MAHRFYRGRKSLTQSQSSVFRGNYSNSPVQHFTVTVSLNREHAHELSLLLEQDHEKIPLELAAKSNLVVVKALLKVATSVSDGNARIPVGERTHDIRNIRARELFVTVALWERHVRGEVVYVDPGHVVLLRFSVVPEALRQGAFEGPLPARGLRRPSERFATCPACFPCCAAPRRPRGSRRGGKFRERALAYGCMKGSNVASEAAVSGSLCVEALPRVRVS